MGTWTAYLLGPLAGPARQGQTETARSTGEIVLPASLFVQQSNCDENGA